MLVIMMTLCLTIVSVLAMQSRVSTHGSSDGVPGGNSPFDDGSGRGFARAVFQFGVKDFLARLEPLDQPQLRRMMQGLRFVLSTPFCSLCLYWRHGH